MWKNMENNNELIMNYLEHETMIENLLTQENTGYDSSFFIAQTFALFILIIASIKQAF